MIKERIGNYDLFVTCQLKNFGIYRIAIETATVAGGSTGTAVKRVVADKEGAMRYVEWFARMFHHDHTFHWEDDIYTSNEGSEGLLNISYERVAGNVSAIVAPNGRKQDRKKR